jgi:hypothetical protein
MALTDAELQSGVELHIDVQRERGRGAGVSRDMEVRLGVSLMRRPVSK